MTSDEFAALVEAFSHRAVIPPGGQRHVYLWRGALEALMRVLPSSSTTVLDLAQLARSLPRRPSDPGAARQLLVHAISDWLNAHPIEPASRSIVAVTGCELMERYQVPLAPFVQRATDNLMITLVAPDYKDPTTSLPSYVSFSASAGSEYLKGLFHKDCIVS